MTIDIRIDRIYRAAHKQIPAQAAEFSKWGVDIAHATATIQKEIAPTGHAIGGQIGALGEEITFRLRQLTRTLNDCAVALDQIADDFSARDAEAQAFLAGHAKWLETNGYEGTPDQAPLPDLPKDL